MVRRSTAGANVVQILSLWGNHLAAHLYRVSKPHYGKRVVRNVVEDEWTQAYLIV